jgi:hypothetical protein
VVGGPLAPAEYEAELNRVYDTEHFPMLSKTPGVCSAARYRLEHSLIVGVKKTDLSPNSESRICN